MASREICEGERRRRGRRRKRKRRRRRRKGGSNGNGGKGDVYMYDICVLTQKHLSCFLGPGFGQVRGRHIIGCGTCISFAIVA